MKALKQLKSVHGNRNKLKKVLKNLLIFPAKYIIIKEKQYTKEYINNVQK